MLARHPIGLASVVLLVTTGHLQAQQVECQLSRTVGDTIEGECTPDQVENPTLEKIFPAPIRLYPGESEDPEWVGWVMLGKGKADLSVESYSYWSGPVTLINTPFGWFIPDTLDLRGDPPRLVWDLDDQAPPSSLDLAILTQARSLISDESAWDRRDDRECAPSDMTYSLYCSLAEATRQVTGEYRHRQPALQVVRRVVGERWSERIENHRLMNFNNHPATSYDDVMKAFEIARAHILKALR